MALNVDDLHVESFETGGGSDGDVITDPAPVYKCTQNPAHDSACHVCWNTGRTMCYRSCEITCVVCTDRIAAEG
jgi:hypothetical protein